MDVQLYVYDLSKGLARLMSMGLVGIQIDAVYHTSIVTGGVEYFYGAGVQTCIPGQTHHGQPMEVVNLGKTELPMDVVLTYLESLKEQYTAQNYDLFHHNCNNFSHDFSMFLLGKGIPDHITSLPSQVLNTPFGSMMKNQLDQSMRSVTQAAVPPEKNPIVQAEAAAARKERAQHQTNGSSSRPANTDVAKAVVEQAVQQAAQPGQNQTSPPNNKPKKLETRNGAAQAQTTPTSKHPRKLEVRGTGSESSKAEDSSGDNAPPKKLPRKLEVRDEDRLIDAYGSVRNLTSATVLDDILSSAKETCAVIFFTSSTCAPCKLAYPTYDTLAAENPRVPFIKVDINQAGEIAQKYTIRATPTFMTFLHGHKSTEWQGANPAQLKANIELLLQTAFPPHPHTALRVPTLQFGSLRPVTFSKIPPLDKLTAKMGDKGRDPAVTSLTSFITSRSTDSTKSAPLPDLPAIARFLRSTPSTLPKDVLFTAYDLLRCALLDPRVSGWFAEETSNDSTSSTSTSETLTTLLTHVHDLIVAETCPYNLRLTTIQLCANLFTTPLLAKTVLRADDAQNNGRLSLPTLMTKLASESLLSEPSKPAARSAAASLALNLSTTTYRLRREEEREALSEAAQVELAAGLLELISTETETQGKDGAAASAEVLRVAITAFGYLVFHAPRGGELADLCGALDARATVEGAKGVKGVEKIAREVGEVLGRAW